MSSDEWVEVFNHLRLQVRVVGLTELDDIIASDFRTSQSPSRDTLRYLDTLISSLKERSQLGYKQALENLRNSVDTESGHPIEDIEIVMTGDDVRLFGIERMSLASTE